MHGVPRLLIDLAIVLGVAGLMSLLFHRLRLPVMLGYVLAGVMVGPYVPVPLVADEGNVKTLADLGVILLMFSIGLEFNVQKLLRAGPSALLMGTLQVGFAFFLGSSAAQFLGWSQTEAIFTGAALSISSTMVVAKIFEETPPLKETRTSVFSILIIQDLFAMLLLTAMATFGKVGSLDPSGMGETLFKLSIFLLVVLGLGRLFVPRFIRWVADHTRSESLLITSTGLCFICAIAADHAGFPVALGAFLGGMLASESGRIRSIERQILPLKDLFTAIFFVAVGMMFDPRGLLAYAGPILLLSLLVVLGNILSITSGALLAGINLRTAIHSSLALGQIGEFGYILLGLGISLGVVRKELYGVGVAVGLLTALCTPFAMRLAAPLCRALEVRLPSTWKSNLELYQTWAESLRKRGIRRGEGRMLRRPFIFMVLDGILLAALVPAFSYLLNLFAPFLTGHLSWGRHLGQVLVSALLGALAAMLVLGILRQGRILARDLAVLAPSNVSGGVARRGRHLLAGGLRVAILLMIGLPMVAILQPFAPDGYLLAIALLVFGVTIFMQLRQARRLQRETPGGTEWLLHQIQAYSPQIENPKKPHLFHMLRRQWRNGIQKKPHIHHDSK